MATSIRLYIDLDGVLADFDRGVLEITGRLPAAQPLGAMWRALARSPDFFATLPFAPGGERLWRHCAPLAPTILTGVPWGDWAAPQKRHWVAERLGPDVPVITCMSREKAGESGPGHILIDDRASLRAAWEAAGGVFIHHTDADSTITALEAARSRG
jgi:hypothetical protein